MSGEGNSSIPEGGSKTSKSSHYSKDKNLPKGWKYLETAKNTTSFKTKEGKYFINRKKALAAMYDKAGVSKDCVYDIRDGVLDEGWSEHRDLPPGWWRTSSTVTR